MDEGLQTPPRQTYMAIIFLRDFFCAADINLHAARTILFHHS